MLKKAYSYLLLLSSLFWLDASAQNITKSPYSIIGLGEMVFAGNASNLAMGQITQGVRRNYEINWLNPASYSSLRQTNIEAGGTFSYGKFQGTSQSSEVNTAWLAYLNFGMPLSVKKGMGVAFGLSPFTGVGYNIASTLVIPNDTFNINANYLYNGRGGLSRFYAGYGMRLHKDLSVGVNFNYVFGQVKNTTQLFIPSQYNMFNLNEDRSTFVHGSVFDLAAQYHKTFRFTNYDSKDKSRFHQDSLDFVFGVNFRPSSDLNAEQQYVLRTLPLGALTGSKDTVLITDNSKGILKMPSSIKIGMSIGKADRWMLAADYRSTDWSKYSSYGVNDSLQTSFGYSIGGFYCPDPYDIKNFFNRIEYRAGFRYDQTNIKVNGLGINEWAISTGFGIPLARSRSKLNLGFEYVDRGTNENNLIKENYFRFIIGINFSDRWFVRYRYD
ncbi:MAG: hypothetical protein ACOVP1_07390, partial [Bacteroidia bacterium]